MKTLFVAWRTPNPSYAWFPVGRLDADLKNHDYVFRYTQGALNAHDTAGFEPHVSEAGRHRAESLHAQERLQIALEMNNPATRLAVQLQSADGQLLGWAPRYLVSDLAGAMVEFTELTATVIRSNPQEAPLARRLLIEMAGRLPASVEPMTSADFKPVVSN